MILPMRTCERCNIWKRNRSKIAPMKRAACRWPSIWGRAGDIPFSKSSGQRKTLRDGRFGEGLYRGDRAILRFWWPTQRKLDACWDGQASAISPRSSQVRGRGCRKTRRGKKRLLRQAHAFEQIDVGRPLFFMDVTSWTCPRLPLTPPDSRGASRQRVLQLSSCPCFTYSAAHGNSNFFRTVVLRYFAPVFRFDSL